MKQQEKKKNQKSAELVTVPTRLEYICGKKNNSLKKKKVAVISTWTTSLKL